MRKRRSTVDLDQIMRKGGAPRVALLQHCVKAVAMEPILLFLAGEYAFRPTSAGAIALYDMFCAPTAPGRVNALHALPPRALGLSSSIAQLREGLHAGHSVGADIVSPARRLTPFRNLFDGITAALRADPDGPVAILTRRYDPRLTPVENLPGGKMTAGQRRFVDGVWRPLVRPCLVHAGFWQLSTID